MFAQSMAYEVVGRVWHLAAIGLAFERVELVSEF